MTHGFSSHCVECLESDQAEDSCTFHAARMTRSRPFVSRLESKTNRQLDPEVGVSQLATLATSRRKVWWIQRRSGERFAGRNPYKAAETENRSYHVRIELVAGVSGVSADAERARSPIATPRRKR